MRLVAAGGDAIFNEFVVEDDIRILRRDVGRTMVVSREKIYKELKVVVFIRHENQASESTVSRNLQTLLLEPVLGRTMVVSCQIVIYKEWF